MANGIPIHPLNPIAQGGSGQPRTIIGLSKNSSPGFSRENTIRGRTFAIGGANTSALQRTGALPVISSTKQPLSPKKTDSCALPVIGSIKQPENPNRQICLPTVLPKTTPVANSRLSLQDITPSRPFKGSSNSSKTIPATLLCTENPKRQLDLKAVDAQKKTLSNSLCLPFNPVDFSKELTASKLNINGAKPKRGGNGIVAIHRHFVLKADDPDNMRTEYILDKYLDSCSIKVPQSHMLSADQVATLKKYSPRYDLEGKDVMVMAKVIGVTFKALIENPKFKKQFNANIKERMQDIGRLAAFDMLIGNSDRLVALRIPDKELRPLPMANIGNWMYTVSKNKLDRGVVAIDNLSFAFPEDDKPESMKPYVEVFVDHIQNKTKDVADHILVGIGWELQDEKKKVEDLTFLRSLVLKKFNEDRNSPVTYPHLQKYVVSGLKQGINDIKANGDNKILQDLINTAATIKEHRLCNMIAARVRELNKSVSQGGFCGKSC